MAYSKMKFEEIKCETCGEIFTPKRNCQRFCSLKCRQSAQFNRFSAQTGSPRKLDVPCGTTGAMHELLVCADLMSKGYHVFRAQSPHSPCDVIAMIDGVVYKIEITTGYKRNDGGYSYPKKNDRYDYDVMAVVFHDGDVIYLESGVSGTPPNKACSGLAESSASQRESTLKKLSARRVLSQPAANR